MYFKWESIYESCATILQGYTKRNRRTALAHLIVIIELIYVDVNGDGKSKSMIYFIEESKALLTLLTPYQIVSKFVQLYERKTPSKC